MIKEIRLNGFDMNCVGHIQHGKGRSSALPVIFAAELFELCTHCCEPMLEDIDDRVADLGRRKGGSV
jgi:hypothetical protein